MGQFTYVGMNNYNDFNEIGFAVGAYELVWQRKSLTSPLWHDSMELPYSQYLEGKNMSLIMAVFCKNGDKIMIGDSRSTTYNNRLPTYDDNEQKIFHIEDSPFILGLTGCNRFTPDNRSIKPFISSCKSISDCGKLIEHTEDFLFSFTPSGQESCVMLIDTRENQLIVIEAKEEQKRTSYVSVQVAESAKIYTAGTNWAMGLAQYYRVISENTTEEIENLKRFYQHIYGIASSLCPENNVIAPPTQILVGHPDGSVEEYV